MAVNVQAWRIFTPLLHEIDDQKPPVVPYPFGSLYPPGFQYWSAGMHHTERRIIVFVLCV